MSAAACALGLGFATWAVIAERDMSYLAFRPAASPGS
jgi:hypothetical protein